MWFVVVVMGRMLNIKTKYAREKQTGACDSDRSVKYWQNKPREELVNKNDSVQLKDTFRCQKKKTIKDKQVVMTVCVINLNNYSQLWLVIESLSSEGENMAQGNMRKNSDQTNTMSVCVCERVSECERERKRERKVQWTETAFFGVWHFLIYGPHGAIPALKTMLYR